MIRRIRTRWHEFWFAPTSAATIVVMRTLLGVSSLAWALSILPDLRTFYFDDGLLGPARYADHRLGLFQWFTSDTAVVVMWIVMAVASCSLIFGRWVRVGAPLLWIATLTMQQGAVSALNAGDLLLRIWTTYIALYALLTPGRIIDTPLFGRPDGSGGRTWGLASPWIVRIAQIQLTASSTRPPSSRSSTATRGGRARRPSTRWGCKTSLASGCRSSWRPTSSSAIS